MANIRVGVAAIIKNSDNEILMIKRKNSPAKGLWGFPGGGIEFGETVEAATKREVREETGFDVEVGKTITVGEAIEKANDIHRVVIVSEAKIKSGNPKASDDAAGIMWINIDKINKIKKEISPYSFNNLKTAGYLK